MRTFTLIMGIVFLAVGLLGFVPALVSDPPPGHDLMVEHSHGLLLGLFPVNVLHNLVHILFGVWGIAAKRSDAASRGYLRTVAIAYAVLAVAGFIPGLDTMFGLVPLHGDDIWLHALLAVAAGYFGFVHRTAPGGGMARTY